MKRIHENNMKKYVAKKVKVELFWKGKTIWKGNYCELPEIIKLTKYEENN